MNKRESRLMEEKNKMLQFISVVQVTVAHLLQDGEISEGGLTSAKNLLEYSEQLLGDINES